MREALRGPRRVPRVWATERRRARALAGGRHVERATAEEIAARCGSDAHQGVCAEVRAVPLRRRRGRCWRGPDPLIVALDEVTDPQNLGAICRTAEVAGATGVVIPERRAAEVTPAVCKASAGAVEHLPIAHVRNLADFLADAKAAGCWCYGAAAGARTPYDAPDYSGGVVLVLGAEGRACGRASRRRATTCLAAAARADRLAERRAPPPRCCCTGSCSRRLDTST